MSGTELLLVAIAGLCPLSFLMGIAAVILVLIQLGHIGPVHTFTLEGVRASEIDEKVRTLARDGWQYQTAMPIRSQVDEGDGTIGTRTQFILIFKKRRLT